MKLRQPALAIDVECIGIGPQIRDKPPALQPWTARIVCMVALNLESGREFWFFDSSLLDADYHSSSLGLDDQSACDGDALLLAARQFRGHACFQSTQSDLLEFFARQGVGRCSRLTGDGWPIGNIVENG